MRDQTSAIIINSIFICTNKMKGLTVGKESKTIIMYKIKNQRFIKQTNTEMRGKPTQEDILNGLWQTPVFFRFYNLSFAQKVLAAELTFPRN